ncbi:MAG: RNA polymerase sigma-70 factor [Bacteroidales bacterium]
MGLNNLSLQISGGDKMAFESFYLKEYKKAVFYAHQYLSDYNLAEDVVQDSFTTLWIKRSSLDPNYPVQPYLYSIIRNNTLNILKRLSIDNKVKDSILQREYKANLNALSHDSAQAVIAAELSEEIAKTLANMPETVSGSFIKSRIKGMTYKEIAENEGTSVKIVEYHITQALKIFREKLKDFLLSVLF